MLSVIAVLFGGFPAWLQMVWALFSSEPLVPWAWEHRTAIHFGNLSMSPLWALWITAPISVVFLFLIWRQGRKPGDESQPRKVAGSVTLGAIQEQFASPAAQARRSFKQFVEDHTITVPGSPIKEGFTIEALPPVPDTLNMTQHSWHEGANITFSGDAVLAVTNELPAQGIDLVHFRLLSISPSMKSKQAWKPSTLDAKLKQIDFSADIPATVVAGKTNDVRLFKATRPFSVLSLKDITIEFYGRWPEGYYSVFNPGERHLLIVEVTGSGISRTEETFELSFSTDKTKPVFTLTKVRRYKDSHERESRALLLAVVDRLKAGVKPLKALQEAKADELETNDMLLELRGDLIKFRHTDPFDVIKGTIPDTDFLEFLVAARLQGIDLSDELGLLDLLTDRSPDIKPMPPTVHELFQTDFPNYFKWGHEGETHSKADDGRIVKTKIEYFVHQDFATKSRFISVYVTSSPASFQVCKGIADFYPEILKESETLQVISKSPLDAESEHSKDLTFTGKIYVYYEDDFSLEQLGEMSSAYKGKNLSPQFRGRNYAVTYWLEKKARNAK